MLDMHTVKPLDAEAIERAARAEQLDGRDSRRVGKWMDRRMEMEIGFPSS